MGNIKQKPKPVDPVEVIIVVDNEDKDDGKECRSKGLTDLAGALAKAFTHNSADPKVAALTLARPVASGSMCHSRRSTPVETLSGSASVEVVLPLLMKCRHVTANDI
jgi:hypothetical protein